MTALVPGDARSVVGQGRDTRQETLASYAGVLAPAQRAPQAIASIWRAQTHLLITSSSTAVKGCKLAQRRTSRAYCSIWCSQRHMPRYQCNPWVRTLCAPWERTRLVGKFIGPANVILNVGWLHVDSRHTVMCTGRRVGSPLWHSDGAKPFKHVWHHQPAFNWECCLCRLT